MTRLIYLVIGMALFFANNASAQELRAVKSFDKVIVSPYIQVKFVEGAEESVTILSNATKEENLHIEVKGKTLRIYLEDAKLFPMEEKLSNKGKIVDREYYDASTVTAIVTYKTLKEISVRGEEDFEFLSPLKRNDFQLTVYGSSTISLKEVDLKLLKATLYGESKLKIKTGNVQEQKFTSYGTSSVDAIGISNKDTRIISYGSSKFQVHADQSIKITAYGDTFLEYSGKAEIKKGINIGEVKINKI